ncbi:MAG: transglutaminase family protein [Microthrixaceae bacterium]
MPILDEFASAMQRPEPPLDRATALIASAGRDGVDADDLVAQLDGLADRMGGGIGRIDAASICSTLFAPGGLEGDRLDYYAPDNSLLDRVLERRRGIPITLSVIAIEVARRLEVPLVGVGMPGHFLVGDGARPDRWFDVFDHGRPLDLDGARARFAALHGAATPFDAGLLARTSTTGIVLRMLNNLAGAYLRLGDREGATRAVRLQSRVPGTWPGSGRRLAQLLEAGGRFGEAARTYEQLATHDPDEADQHRVAAQRLWARLN